MKLRLIVLAAVLALASTAALASAEEVTRESYKAQVEPICKTNRQADERLLDGIKRMVRKGEYRPAAKKISKAATALQKAYVQLQAVPQPPADEARLTKWLSYLKQEVSLFKASVKALNAGQKGKIVQLQVKIDRTAQLANGTVLMFGFHYCKVDTSKIS